MFFRRQLKNRRLAREHILDVKLRSSQVRAARSRMAIIAALFLVGGAAALYSVYRAGDWALDRFLYKNPSFAIQEIDLQTDGILVTDEIRRWAGVSVGQNLLALDLARVKKNLEVVPFIQSVSVERILPRTLRIRVVEREPIAQVNIPRPRASGLLEPVPYHLDAEGWLMPPLEPNQRSSPPNPAAEQLPLLVGLKPNELEGRSLDSAQVRAAVQLIQAFDRSAIAAVIELKKVDISSAEVLVATTAQGSEITFAPVDFDQQIRRWKEIYDTARKTSKAIASLDLAVSNNIPAKFLEASVVPPVPPRLPRAFHNKKKHV
jgi:cell division septal protein FtsQ